MFLRTVALCLLAAASAPASYLDDIGYTDLQTSLGAGTPTGAGVTVSQIEAKENGVSYLPDTSVAEFAGKTFTTKSEASAASGHATLVGQYYYGSVTSTARGVTSIDNYEASDWIGAGLLNYGETGLFGGTAPASESRDVENHSWVSTSGSAGDQEILRRFDYAIQHDDFVAVVGLNNGAETPLPNLLASAYNAISVGRSDGVHSSGTTTVDGTGRVKPEIVSPVNFTSFATPTVGSAAAVLIGKARESTALANGAKSQTIKALLLAGATKAEFPGWARTTTRPLDAHYGAGELNIFNSYNILVAGQQPPGNTSPVPPRGWDFKSSVATGSDLYFFDVPEGSKLPTFSVVLTWNRVIKDTLPGPGWGMPSSTLANLSLRLYNATGFTVGTLVDASLSEVDNVEHIYRTNLPAGRYAMEVTSDTPSTPYGLAWTGTATALPALAINVNDATASEFGPDTGSFLVTRTGNLSEPLTVAYTVGGTATNGSDYTTITSTVTIPAETQAATVTISPIPDALAEGDETVTLTLGGDPGYVIASPATAALTIRDKPFDAWRKSKFTASELAAPAVSGELADPDGDGLVNLREYGFYEEPKTASVARLPKPSIDANGFLTLTYRRRVSAIDLLFVAEISDDLFTWNSGGTHVQELVQRDGADPDLEMVTIRSTTPAATLPKQFLRIGVVRP